jgi:hypothetical protein
MEKARLRAFQREQATAKTCMVSSFATDFLEIRAKEPSVHVLVIPGNPGIVAFYKDFVEELYENLGGQASITGKCGVIYAFFVWTIYVACCLLINFHYAAIGHISHSKKVMYSFALPVYLKLQLIFTKFITGCRAWTIVFVA